MGSVWVADHLGLQTQVVVKFMHAELAGDKASLMRFSREAAANASVKSPHVVQVLDHGIAPDQSPFIVMEFLEGCDLATHLERHGPMPLTDVGLVVSQTCKALARAHERGIMHRDIKPQNLFMTNAGDGELLVKVLDFGIAKTTGAPHAGAQPPSVTIDGAVIPEAALDAPRKVNPGAHLIVAMVAQERREAQVNVAEGETQAVSVDYPSVSGAPAPVPSSALPSSISTGQQAPAASAASPPSAATPAGPDTSAGPAHASPPLGGYVLLGVGGAGAAVATVFGLIALNNKNGLDAACGTNKQNCPVSAQSDISGLHTNSLVSDVATGVAAAGFVIGGALVLFHSSHHATAQTQGGTVRVEPWVGLSAAGFRGTF
jgi:serine/threonine protein kinase